MRIKYEKNKVVLTDLNRFHIEQILECGQCFHFEKVKEHHYRIIAYGRMIEVLQEDNKAVILHATKKEFEEIWSAYFDLSRNYGEIVNKLEKDEILKKAIAYKPGIRILKQEPFECLISFIISQNKQIPHIKQIIRNISERFGTKKQLEDGQGYYAFPTLEQLAKAKEEDLRECKAGFRAKYIVDACGKLCGGIIDLDTIGQKDLVEARQELLKIKGVGNKVADCMLLYGLGYHEAFPKDVWIKRIMEFFYFDGKDTKMDIIEEYARGKFGNLAGFAQQYLFYYAREFKIGK